MNKKVNTVLFIIGATVFNVIVTVSSFFLLLIFYARVHEKILPETGMLWPIVLIFIAAIVISFLVYKFAIGFLIKKINVEKYFDPIINSRYRPKKRNED